MTTYYNLKSDSHKSSFILYTSTINPNTNQKPYTGPRTLSQVGSSSYQRSLRRAFSRAKLISFFNPDMKYFITFTYSSNMTNSQQALKDIKLYLQTEKRKYSRKVSHGTQKKALLTKKTNEDLSTFPQVDIKNRNQNSLNDLKNKKNKKTRRRTCGNVDKSNNKDQLFLKEKRPFEEKQKNKENPFKYIFVFETQKRGAIHIHMICNGLFEMEINKNGYRQLKNWKHGFTSVLTINDFDSNFKPYLYLFKYMTKAQRVGKSFIHTSRNSFDKIISLDYDKYINTLLREDIIYKEDFNIEINEKKHRVIKEYIRKKN